MSTYIFRKQNKNKIQKLFLLLAAVSLILPLQSINADTQSDIAQQKAQKQAQLDQLNQQIKDYQNQIAAKRKQSASLSNEISLYDIQIRSTQLQIQATQTNIDNTNLQIQETKDQIAQKTQQIEQEKQVLGQLIVELSKYDNASTLQLGLGSNNFSDFLDQVQYTQSIQSKVYDLLQKIKDIRAKLQQDEQDLEANLNKLQTLEGSLTATQNALNDQRTQKAQLLSLTKGQENRYQKLLSQSQSEQDQIQKEIYDLDQQMQGNKAFNRLPVVHGILAWPMDGVITQGYGNTGFTKLGYNFHNGIDIAAPPGTPIYAAADGYVVATGKNVQTGYGNWVAMKHPTLKGVNGALVTLYAHMTNFVVTVGQQLKQGDLIGYEGNTGNTTRLIYGPDRGYHLHFTVFDANGFGVKNGAYPKIYGPYQLPYGYTYDPRDYL